MLRGLMHSAIIAAAILWLGKGGATPTFSLASLNGTCIWQVEAITTTSGVQAGTGPATTLSEATFDGAGHVTIQHDVNLDGTFTSTPAPIAGTYTVDPNGHGTLLYVNPSTANTVDSDFFITPLGKAILTQTRGFNTQTVTPRVSNGTCIFSE
ncbi:MAG TPA: hypothetical protein VKV28_01415 [Candidatus Binataceae bacterium]|nr:hypothetical protein [Candidatus Binataceae bacterium]